MTIRSDQNPLIPEHPSESPLDRKKPQRPLPSIPTKQSKDANNEGTEVKSTETGQRLIKLGENNTSHLRGKFPGSAPPSQPISSESTAKTSKVASSIPPIGNPRRAIPSTPAPKLIKTESETKKEAAKVQNATQPTIQKENSNSKNTKILLKPKATPAPASPRQASFGILASRDASPVRKAPNPTDRLARTQAKVYNSKDLNAAIEAEKSLYDQVQTLEEEFTQSEIHYTSGLENLFRENSSYESTVDQLVNNGFIDAQKASVLKQDNQLLKLVSATAVNHREELQKGKLIHTLFTEAKSVQLSSAYVDFHANAADGDDILQSSKGVKLAIETKVVQTQNKIVDLNKEKEQLETRFNELTTNKQFAKAYELWKSNAILTKENQGEIHKINEFKKLEARFDMIGANLSALSIDLERNTTLLGKIKEIIEVRGTVKQRVAAYETQLTKLLEVSVENKKIEGLKSALGNVQKMKSSVQATSSTSETRKKSETSEYEAGRQLKEITESDDRYLQVLNRNGINNVELLRKEGIIDIEEAAILKDFYQSWGKVVPVAERLNAELKVLAQEDLAEAPKKLSTIFTPERLRVLEQVHTPIILKQDTPNQILRKAYEKYSAKVEKQREARNKVESRIKDLRLQSVKSPKDQKLFGELIKQKAELDKVITSLEMKEAQFNQMTQDFIQPAQRIMRYATLLQEISKRTPEVGEDPKTSKFAEVTEKVVKTNLKINESRKKYDELLQTMTNNPKNKLQRSR